MNVSVEEVELFNLIVSKQLISTSKSEWTGNPNEFVQLKIPDSILTFISNVEEYGKQSGINIKDGDICSCVITMLVMKGLYSLRKEINSINELDKDINTIMNNGITLQ